jgi:poly(A) polymerase
MADTQTAGTADACSDSPLAVLSAAGFSVCFHGFSAIDAYLGRRPALDVRLLTNAGVTDLARLFEGLRFPGADIADAALDGTEWVLYFECADSGESAPACGMGFPFPAADYRPSFTLLEWYQDWKSRRFYDPHGLYPLLRRIQSGFRGAAGGFSVPDMLRDSLDPGAERCRALMDAALIAAKYLPGEEAGGQIKRIAELFRGLREGPRPGEEEQRLLLAGLLTAPNPGFGLELLKRGGFIGEFWPELAGMDDVDHSKEFHPEGNVWKHTLETFRYRKAGQKAVYDLRLSLGLLLHDAGKPIAESAGSRRFDGHAELGERQARRFLERLGFAPALITDVCYLVRNHMLPAALPRLPLTRTGGIMASPLFPTLLELYRCDESSSFKGLDGYYESSAAYQSYLRYRRNPYRSADGKKLNQRQLAGAGNGT